MSDERGFTVVELTVTLGILSIVIGAVLMFIAQATTVSARAGRDVRTESDGRIALRSMTEDLRAAEPSSITFTGPTSVCPSSPSPSNCISFTIVRDTTGYASCQSAIVYGWVSNSLKENRTDSGCTNNVSFTGKPVLASVMNGSTPIFTYYDKAGVQLNSGQATAASIGVTLVLQYQGSAPLLTITGYASLRNAR